MQELVARVSAEASVRFISIKTKYHLAVVVREIDHLGFCYIVHGSINVAVFTERNHLAC